METSKHPSTTDSHSPNTTYSTTLPPILSTTHQPTTTTLPILPPPSTLSIVPPEFSKASSHPTSEPQFPSTSPVSDSHSATFQDPANKSHENSSLQSDSGKNQSDTEGSEPEGESTSKRPSGVNLSISNTDELRRLALESRESLEVLAAKTHETTPGSADKARSILISTWLIDNYESADDQSVSREALYSHYTLFCEKIGVHHVNSASFGKIVRSVFSNITTRRLGTRGQSKYLFCLKFLEM
ncbi:hypothetical protein K7432_004217 [Basidiobolus ranarum]|uniref:RFX-type winged-helix domain-containing protein n=1 Tax=Basidiobolus ranarum TaxID=34480 RepID=A0ABR2W5Y2_9FUNG